MEGVGSFVVIEGAEETLLPASRMRTLGCGPQGQELT
jgi:hypothetical protein